MQRWRHLIAVASLLHVAFMLPATAQPYRERGEVLARGMCAGCHAVGRTGDSALPAAPRFRFLGNQLDLSKLAQRIREGLLTGHEEMPMFRFDRDDANAMAAYIRSIQAP
jgi:mono/diheme cytochrome c family protein